MNKDLQIELEHFISIFIIFFGSYSFGSVNHELIVSTNSNKKIELFWSKPDASGLYPVLIMIHPHQTWPDKIGAEVFVKNGSLQRWTDKGFVTVAISQPGYGNSEGAADFCGADSQQAVIETINHFKSLNFVNKDKVFLYGGSRGAVVASMVGAQYPGLAGIVLKSGLYDLVQANDLYEWYNPIRLTMIFEIGWLSDEKLKLRSSFYSADKIKAPLLVIHGTEDDRASMENAKALVNKVNSTGGNAELRPITSEHIIPMSVVEPYMDDFLKKVLR